MIRKTKLCRLFVPFLLGSSLFSASVFCAEDPGWFAFNPSADPFTESAIDLRALNEKFAGEHGVIAAQGDEFVHAANRAPVRFWAVNGPPHDLAGAELPQTARRLAKYGVNLARMHGAMFNKAVVDVEGDEKISAVILEDTVTKARSRLEVKGLFIAIGHTPATEFLKDSGIEFDEAGYVALKTRSGETRRQARCTFMTRVTGHDMDSPPQSIGSAGSSFESAGR